MNTIPSNYLIYELKHHWLAYLILVVGLITGALLFIFAWPNHDYQRIVIAGMSVFYFFWGVVTHIQAQRITMRVISEYFAVSLLAGGLLYFLTL